MAIQFRRPETTSKGYKLPSNNQTSTTVCMSNELFHQIRELALKESRSFSNMMCILAKRGIKAFNESK